jgi:hypothetical protein
MTSPQPSPSGEQVQAHTPTPWSLKRGQFGSSVFVIYGPDEFPIAQTVSNSSPEGMARARRGEHQANAALIVRAVNNHAALVEALTRLCTQFPTDSDMANAGWESTAINEACSAYDAARAAIARATT